MFPGPTSEFENTALVSINFLITNCWKTNLQREIRSNVRRFRPISLFLEPWILSFSVLMTSMNSLIFIVDYCLTACLYEKCCNLIGWILELGPSIHFRIDGPDRLYDFRSKLMHGIFGKMVEKLSTEVVKC